MLIKTESLKNYKLNSLDGEIGKVKECYFDDRNWTIRYLVVDTGKWLVDRKVLISPQKLGAVDKEERHIVVNLTKKQIEDSPSIESDKPVSRQFEDAYEGYYGISYLWKDTHLSEDSSDSLLNPEYLSDLNYEESREARLSKKEWDSHLHSTHDVKGHNIQALDGEIGRIENFLFDDKTWTIRYIIADTCKLWACKNVLISPRWIERISWKDAKVYINHMREMIKDAPEYTDATLLTREYETVLHSYYNLKGYWVDEKN